MKHYFLYIFIALLGSCDYSNKKVEKTTEKFEEAEDTIKEKKDNSFLTYVKIDTLYKKPGRFISLYVSNETVTDTLPSACSCDKNVKDNSIKIQIKTAIPTKKELDTLSLNSKYRTNRLLQLYSLHRDAKPFKGQLKYINIEMKDSVVKNINIISRSSEFEYSGENFKKEPIEKYKIKISRFNYHNASKVYGKFEILLPNNFGLIKNDSIIRGSFLCMNWIINEEQDIRSWKIN